MVSNATPHMLLVTSPDSSAATYRRVRMRLLPFLFVSYLVAFLDRNNIGFAKLEFTRDLGMTEAAYGLAAGIFYIGYILFEIPSNLMLSRIGARRTLTRIMLLWGAAAAGTAFVTSPAQLYVMRFLLGAAEAGFFPGVLLYLTYWTPSTQRARFTSLFMTAIPLSGAIGSPISGWIMQNFASTEPLRAWQWLLLIEGLPACALGIVAYLYLTDSPAEATWLSAGDRATIAADLEHERASKATTSHHSLSAALGDGRFHLLALMAFALFSASTGFFFWLPTILRDLGVGNVLSIGLLSGGLFVVAAISQVLNGRHSDRVLERRWHTAVPALVGAVGWILLALGPRNPTFVIAMLALAAAGSFGAMPTFWTMPAAYLTGSAAAGGIAVISTLGAIGGFVSPTVIGWIVSRTGTIALGQAYLSVLLASSALVTLLVLPKRSVT
jgi:sugar phosphate permease